MDDSSFELFLVIGIAALQLDILVSDDKVGKSDKIGMSCENISAYFYNSVNIHINRQIIGKRFFCFKPVALN